MAGQMPLDPASPPVLAESEKCDGLAEYLSRPDLPKKVLRAGSSGWAVIRYDLDGSGRAQNIVSESAAPEQVYERNSVLALQRSKFKPGTIRTGCKILMVFSLNAPVPAK